jgi:DNA-binding PadR family transcriptional regulator
LCLDIAYYLVILYSSTKYHYVVGIPYHRKESLLENITEMLKGTLEGCVLEIINRGSTYGYEIAQQLHALGFTDVVEGTVYAILIRLERNGLIRSEKKPSELGPPRKLHSLTSSGHEELALFWGKWEFVSSRINILKEQK